MLKSFKLISTFLFAFTWITCVVAQDDVKFKDVLLDGKPAKLNVATGEVTLVKLMNQNSATESDSVKTRIIVIPKPEVINTSNETKVLNDDGSDFYTVKEGDNLFQISVKYNISLTELKEANNLETTLIKKGQKLRVRNFDRQAEVPSVWIVKKGDNLYRIAIKSGTTVESIKQINGLTSNLIKIGQKLQLK